MDCYKIEYPPKPLKRTAVNKVSTTQKKRTTKYLDERKKYLEKFPICEAQIHEVCTRIATDIHHKQGRDGENLYNHFLAVCRNCHNYIETHPEEAKERGFSESRLK